jgi:putative CocE/NonD family hydrolase
VPKEPSKVSTNSSESVDQLVTTRRTLLSVLAAAMPTTAVTRLSALKDPSSSFVPLDDPSIRVVENLWIPLPDGTRLAARAFFPGNAGENRCGTVVECLPYRKRDMYRYRDDVAGPIFAKRGLVYLRVDVRGTGDSSGALADEYTEIEQHDVLELFRWIASQPWSNGSVGMRGISYGSFNSLEAAGNAPPELKAIVSCCGSDQRYADDIHYRGGCLIHDQFGWATEWQVIMRSPPDPAIVGGDRWLDIWRERLEAASSLAIAWTEHQTNDAKWKVGSVSDYGRIRAAILNVGGVLDCYVPSATRMLERAPHVPQKTLLGPWTHKWPGYPDPPHHRGPPSDAANGLPGPGIDWLPVECRWWRHWLNGEANAIMEGPILYAFRANRTGAAAYPKDTSGQWVSESIWPSPNVEARVLYLNPTGLANDPGERRRLLHKTNLTIGFTNRSLSASGPGEWCREQSGDDAMCLSFDSAPLVKSLDILGEPTFALRVRSDKPVAKICARLTDVTPDGRSHFVSYAILNLTHRRSDEHPEPLTPGEDYDITLTGLFACYRFAAGHRIRLAISETCWPAVWPSPEPVTLEVTTGVSKVLLPERLRGSRDTLPYPQWFERYEVDGVTPHPYFIRLEDVAITGPPGARIFNLDSGPIKDIAERHVPGPDLYTGEAFRLRRTIREDDSNSAEIETEAIMTFRRGSWRVKVRSWTLARSTATHFIIEEAFEAWNGEERLASRHWSKEISRQFV